MGSKVWRHWALRTAYPLFWSWSPLATMTFIVPVSASMFIMPPSFSWWKLWVEPESTKIVKGTRVVLAWIHMVWGVWTPAKAWREIFGCSGLPSSRSDSACSSSWFWSVSCSSSLYNLLQKWSDVNFSLQRKHKPCQRCCCSSIWENWWTAICPCEFPACSSVASREITLCACNQSRPCGVGHPSVGLGPLRASGVLLSKTLASPKAADKVWGLCAWTSARTCSLAYW